MGNSARDKRDNRRKRAGKTKPHEGVPIGRQKKMLENAFAEATGLRVGDRVELLPPHPQAGRTGEIAGVDLFGGFRRALGAKVRCDDGKIYAVRGLGEMRKGGGHAQCV